MYMLMLLCICICYQSSITDRAEHFSLYWINPIIQNIFYQIFRVHEMATLMVIEAVSIYVPQKIGAIFVLVTANQEPTDARLDATLHTAIRNSLMHRNQSELSRFQCWLHKGFANRWEQLQRKYRLCVLCAFINVQIIKLHFQSHFVSRSSKSRSKFLKNKILPLDNHTAMSFKLFILLN